MRLLYVQTDIFVLVLRVFLFFFAHDTTESQKVLSDLFDETIIGTTSPCRSGSGGNANERLPCFGLNNWPFI